MCLTSQLGLDFITQLAAQLMADPGHEFKSCLGHMTFMVTNDEILSQSLTILPLSLIQEGKLSAMSQK